MEWLGEAEATADELVAGSQDGGDGSRLQEAKEWLLEALGDGPNPSAKLFEHKNEIGDDMPAYISLCRHGICHQLHDGFTPLEGTDLSTSAYVDQHGCIVGKTLLENIQLTFVEAVRSPAQEFLDCQFV